MKSFGILKDPYFATLDDSHRRNSMTGMLSHFSQTTSTPTTASSTTAPMSPAALLEGACGVFGVGFGWLLARGVPLDDELACLDVLEEAFDFGHGQPPVCVDAATAGLAANLPCSFAAV
jgi:hypothetical protein